MERPLLDSPRHSVDKMLPPQPKVCPSEMTTILVGSKQRRFQVNRQLLCDVALFFRERLDDPFHSQTTSLWLPNESSTMFAYFVEWVHAPCSFRRLLDDTIATSHEAGEKSSQSIHWALVHLHLFASQLSLHTLQDIAMDAIQDLYLKCDWDVPPGLIVYLYTECESLPAIRLRRWAVAMVAFSLAVSWNMKFHPQDMATSDPEHFDTLFQSLPEFAIEYDQHLRNMRASGLDVRFKNPQLRISANKLRNDERLFGFRECSFHSHRAAIGEGTCSHAAFRARHEVSDFSTARMGAVTPKSNKREFMPRSLFSRESSRFSESSFHRRSRIMFNLFKV